MIKISLNLWKIVLEKKEAFSPLSVLQPTYWSNFKIRKIQKYPASWPSDFISGNIVKETQNTYLKEYMHPFVDCSIICQ